MLFDLRGKRKRFIQVIYATLAILMGGGLVFFGIGSDVQGGLFDAFSDQSGGSATFEEDAEDLEDRLRQRPNDPNLLGQLVTTRYTAGQAGITVDETGVPSISEDARGQFDQAVDAWDRYLKATEGKPSPNVALLAANAAFQLAQTSATTDEADANLATAAEAQSFVARSRPSVGTLTTLAQYRYFTLDFKGGDQAMEQALKQASGKGQRRSIERQLEQIRKGAKAYEKQVKAAQKQGGAQGGEALENPLGGLSGGGAPAGP